MNNAKAFIVSQYALIRNHVGNVLILKRPESCRWCLPGGGLEHGEESFPSLQREVLEETNLRVEKAHIFANDIHALRDSIKYCVYFDVVVSNIGEFRISDEHCDYQWLKFQDIPLLPFNHESVRQIVIDYYHKQHRSRVGVHAIIVDAEDMVLVCHRTDHDLWNLPGGKLEANESPWEGVVREVREETGYDVEVIRLIGVYFKPRKNEINFSFFCKVVSGVHTINDKADRIAYFSLASLPKNFSLKQKERIEDFFRNQSSAILKVQKGKSSVERLHEFAQNKIYHKK